MNRIDFFQKSAIASIAASHPLSGKANAFVPAHNWDGYDFGTGPKKISDRLNQGPFRSYKPEEVVPGADVIMATTRSKERVSNYGMGMATYLADEAGPAKNESESLETTLGKLFPLPSVMCFTCDLTGETLSANQVSWIFATTGRSHLTWRSNTTNALDSGFNL